MTYSVNLVAVPEQAIAGIRERGPAGAIASRVLRLRRALEEAGVQAAGPVMARFFDGRSREGDVDYEVSVPVRPRPDGSVPDRIGEARGDLIPAHHAFATQHLGPRGRTRAGFTAIAEELDALGYAIAGPAT
jgi:effector-binding domain-containing protein